MNSWREEQPWKHDAPIDLTEDGTVMLTSSQQPRKDELPIDSTEEGITTLESNKQPPNM